MFWCNYQITFFRVIIYVNLYNDTKFTSKQRNLGEKKSIQTSVRLYVIKIVTKSDIVRVYVIKIIAKSAIVRVYELSHDTVTTTVRFSWEHTKNII
jgi:hypothetical protein